MAENISAAIEAWEKSIAITPSADAYTSKRRFLSPSVLLVKGILKDV